MLTRRPTVPVNLDVQVEGRLPKPVETAAYYTVSEALANAAKHARATTADIQVADSGGVLYVRVRDDGLGGADFSDGSGLIGLTDRAEALGGHLQLDSPPGAGTTLEIELPSTRRTAAFTRAGVTARQAAGTASPRMTSIWLDPEGVEG